MSNTKNVLLFALFVNESFRTAIDDNRRDWLFFNE